MADIMVDIETLGVGPDATILTIGAQVFDPLGRGYDSRHYYARINIDTQLNRSLNDSTIEWWATQPKAIRDEAFSEDDRIELSTALDELGRLIWQSKRLWCQGPHFDCTILEHAYKSYGKALPWQYYNVRDSRTLFGLWTDMPKPPVTHNALEDCRRQVDLVQQTLKHLGVETLK